MKALKTIERDRLRASEKAMRARKKGLHNVTLDLPRSISSLPRTANHLLVPPNFPDSAHCALCALRRAPRKCVAALGIEVPIYSDTALALPA